MGRRTGQTGFVGGGPPEGNPSQRRGVQPSGAGSVVTGPHLFTIGGPGSIAWDAGAAGPGTLGRSPVQSVGVYDRRPWEGLPGQRDRNWIRSNVRAVQGESITLRLVSEPLIAQFARPNYGLVGSLKDVSLSILVAGWEEAQVSSLLPPGADPDPTDPTSAGWWQARLAVMGPNVMGDLITTGRADVDLGAWAGDSRFVAAWIWAYWVNVALPDQLALQWLVHDRPRYEWYPWQPITVSYPSLTLADGPLPAPAAMLDAFAVFRSGSFPYRGGPTFHRYAIINGSSVTSAWDVRYLVGPHPDITLFTGRQDLFTVAPRETRVDTGSTALIAGHSSVGFWGSNNIANGFLGGPTLISVAGSG